MRILLLVNFLFYVSMIKSASIVFKIHLRKSAFKKDNVICVNH